ncbi:MAG TPA: LytTR family DNA-binding domain-containing protein [Phaeodactylibacter sp.]|nr:LytTR family DNA-binding domain-containing protein [Phaeodactylibacter sp.]
MSKVKTIVVDDEPLARARIIKLLGEFDYIQLIGECKNGQEAREAIANYQPDLVFLDIQMPDLNGFDVLSDESLQPLPFIIFVTAYDQYALKAFDVQAVDYLLKPYDEERFMRAVTHAHEQIQQKKEAQLHKKMVALLSAHQAEDADYLTHLSYKEKGLDRQIPVLDIHYFEADGNYLKVHLENKQLLIRQPLQNLAAQLAPSQFLRIHRSLLLNVIAIKAVRYEGNNQYEFELKEGTRLQSSRSYREKIQAFLQEEGNDKLLK